MAPRRTGSNGPDTVRGRVATGGPALSLKSPLPVGEVTTNCNVSLVTQKIELNDLTRVLKSFSHPSFGWWVRRLGSWPLVSLFGS
jgi:hypothetical protein